ncbi:MAG: hypothetical protein ACETVN_03595 [Asgard group archaeon]
MSLSDIASFFSILNSFNDLTSVDQWVLATISGLIGVVAGAGLAYLVQRITQKNVWKRDYALKLAEMVYGSLCNQAKLIIHSIEKEKPFPSSLNFEEWETIQKDYRYYMVDKHFRKKIDTFFEKVQGYNDTIVEFRQTLRRIVKEELVTKLSRTIDLRTEIKPVFTFKNGESRSLNGIVSYLFNYENTKEAIFNGISKNDIKEFSLQIGTVTNGPVNMGKFIEFLDSCVEQRKKPYQSILRKKRGILEDTKKLKDELERRIEEPWNI